MVKLNRTILADCLIGLALVALALWLRMQDLTHFVTADEHNWVYRSAVFFQALLQGDWPSKAVWLTPGVTTTWLGTVSLWLYYEIQAATIQQPLLIWLQEFPPNKIDLDILRVMRGSMAVFTSLMVGGVYGLARRIEFAPEPAWSRSVALLGTLFLLSEPHLLAVSRIIGHDAPVTFFMAGSSLALLGGLNRPAQPDWQTQPPIPYRTLILSGSLAGLALLSKTTSLFLLPFTALAILFYAGQVKRSLKTRFQMGVIWAAALWLTFILCWPAAWVNPWGQTWAVIENAFRSSAGLGDTDIQAFWVVPDLGGWYYWVNGLFKLSPLMLLGLLLAGIKASLIVRPVRFSKLDRSGWSWRWWLLLFALGFTLFMTLGVKKSPRYILPAFPPLAFIAAWGWLNWVETKPWRTQEALKSFWRLGGLILLGGLALFISTQYAPYYFTYLNPLLGGAYTGPWFIRIGWGEGLDELGRWLNQRPEASSEQLGVRYKATIAPFYQGRLTSPVSPEADYVAFYIKQTQSGYPHPEILAYFATQGPLHRVYLPSLFSQLGVEYAQVYQGPAMQLVEPQGRPDDLPLAYRPDHIYAPIGQALRVDLLWPSGSKTNKAPPILSLVWPESLPQLSAPEIMFQTTASLVEIAPGVIVSRHAFTLPPDLPRDHYGLWVNGRPIGNIKARRLAMPSTYQGVEALFNQQIKLIGWQGRVKDDRLHVDLAWQGWREVSNDYTVFVQILDDQGHRLSGLDVAPERGFTTLERKEVMLTHYAVPLPASPVKYDLLIGLYYFAGDDIVTVGQVILDGGVVDQN